MKKLPLLPTIIGTGFGSGFWPWGPGTAGALTGMLIWYALSFMLNSTLLFAVTLSCIVVFTIAGTWAVRRLSPFWGSDPQKVVIDEMVGVWVPLLAVPASDIWLVLASFVLFRLFDILKPLGIRTLDRRKGAFYVMADDILAGVYSLIIIVAVRSEERRVGKVITFCKAQCSAWIASAIDFGTTIILAHVFGLWYGYSTFIGALNGGIANCLINYRWVFHAFEMKKRNIAIRYLVVWGGSILLNTYGTYILTELSDQYFMFSKIIVSVIVAVFWNYQMQYRFVFNSKNK